MKNSESMCIFNMHLKIVIMHATHVDAHIQNSNSAGKKPPDFRIQRCFHCWLLVTLSLLFFWFVNSMLSSLSLVLSPNFSSLRALTTYDRRKCIANVRSNQYFSALNTSQHCSLHTFRMQILSFDTYQWKIGNTM